LLTRELSCPIKNEDAVMHSLDARLPGSIKPRPVNTYLERLIEVRQNAEDILIELGALKVPEDAFENVDERGMAAAFDKWIGG
jgi:hypothetical protein